MSDPSGHDGIGNPEGREQRTIPRGIEVLVKKASVDPAFRELLLEKRAAAAIEIGLELSSAEAATLNSVPRSQIEQIIENTTVPDEHRRVFLGKIAAAMLAVLGLATSGCLYTGSRPREPFDPRTVQGSRPDLPTKESEPAAVDSRKSEQEGQRSAGLDGRDDPLKDKEGRE